MNMLNGIQNFLEFINYNWTSIMVVIGLFIGVGKKVTDYFGKSNEEKIAIAKTQIQETMLRMITDAEMDFNEWNKAGSIKRSQVIEEVYASYPILSKVASQDEIIKWIDEQIDKSLETLREIIAENSAENKDTNNIIQ